MNIFIDVSKHLLVNSDYTILNEAKYPPALLHNRFFLIFIQLWALFFFFFSYFKFTFATVHGTVGFSLKLVSSPGACPLR